jgi:succinyl-CoA:mesaconate CoA transferase
MGRPDLAAEYPTGSDRLAERETLREEIAEWTRARTAEAVVDTLDGAVPAGPVQDTSDIFEDPHVHAREMLATVDQPGADESVTIAGSPIKLSETPTGVERRAPLLDEHHDELLDSIARTEDDGEQAHGDD